jgi:hypothetical protein
LSKPKGLQELKANTKEGGIETKLISGVEIPQVEHPTLAEKVGIKPYTRNDMLHMMV